jgi:hypothetical protein
MQAARREAEVGSTVSQGYQRGRIPIIRQQPRTLHEHVSTNSVVTTSGPSPLTRAHDPPTSRACMNFRVLWQEILCSACVSWHSPSIRASRKGAYVMKTIITVVLLVLAATAAFA